ncbi:MAG TPA: indole-3-glycerol-phosphate synthase, partial [Candidatus Limnocylindria bacterium]|nr:indole-3-glycerol-phosphate synthase [Candidatus Limnocylindria bacterium]
DIVLMDFLETVVAERRADAQAARRHDETPVRSGGARPSFVDAIRAKRAAGRVAVIAEVKRRSPALGTLAADADPAGLAFAYARAGAAAISVLTEPRHWGGSVADLAAVANAVSLPLLYKDVVVDERQLCEAEAAGASAVLLIAEALDDATLASFVARTAALGMVALVEAHEHRAFARAVASGAILVGVNARNLRVPAELDRDRVEALHGLVRRDQLLVAESGLASVADLAALPGRVDAVLVGTALMTAADPGALLSALAETRAIPERGRRDADPGAGLGAPERRRRAGG